MTNYLLEWLGINDMGLMFRNRIYVQATDEETARRHLVSVALQWGCQVKRIDCLGACPIRKE